MVNRSKEIYFSALNCSAINLLGDIEMSWAENEFAGTTFGDKRLDDRLLQIADKLSQNSTESLPNIFLGWHETKAAYRFFDNPKVTMDKILSSHIEATRRRIVLEKRVLLLQDTTELDYSGQCLKKGIGPLNSETHRGLLFHPLLAVTPERLSLGLVKTHWHARKKLGQEKRCEERGIEEKESHRWILHYREACTLAVLMPQTEFIVVGDRESDILELYMEHAKRLPTERAEWLVRSAQNRSVLTALGTEKKLGDIESWSKPCGKLSFKLPARQGQKARQVTQEIRIERVTLLKTHRRGTREELMSIEASVIHAKELNVPVGETPIEWILLTSIPVFDIQKAQEIIEWYLCRWEIEIYFKTLKSGCRVEQLQLTKAERYMPCLALYLVVAWYILFLSKVSRVRPDDNCENYFEVTDWKIILIANKKPIPETAPTIAVVVKLIARLGGYLHRNSDGPPGVKTLWLGLRRLREISRFNDLVKTVT